MHVFMTGSEGAAMGGQEARGGRRQRRGRALRRGPREKEDKTGGGKRLRNA